MRKTYLSNWYWRVKQRRGGKRALIALARKILTVIYGILKNPESSYSEEIYSSIQEKLAKKRYDRMIKELSKNGFKVEPNIKTA